MSVHGFIELVVSLALVVLGLAVFGDSEVARNFYVIVGVVIFAIWFASDYRNAQQDPAPEAKS